MKLILKEEPREWRKQAWLTLGGLAVISSLLRWRKVLPPTAWLAILGLLLAAAILAWLQPRGFRGYYRLSMRLGFAISQVMGFVALTLFFWLIITPLGLILRLAGKDSLKLKRPKDTVSYWQPARNSGPLDRSF